VITIKLPDKRAKVAAAAIGSKDDPLIVVTSKGKPKYMRFSLAPHGGRNTKGDSIIALGDGEYVIGVVAPLARSKPVILPEESE
jgi:DNA gyrase/topoisomerase IV subunit A